MGAVVLMVKPKYMFSLHFTVNVFPVPVILSFFVLFTRHNFHFLSPIWTASNYILTQLNGMFVCVQRSDSEEQGGQGEQRASPARPPFGKKQLPSIPKNAVPITKAASPATSAQSANGTHASYGPFYLEYSLLAEL